MCLGRIDLINYSNPSIPASVHDVTRKPLVACHSPHLQASSPCNGKKLPYVYHCSIKKLQLSSFWMHTRKQHMLAQEQTFDISFTDTLTNQRDLFLQYN